MTGAVAGAGRQPRLAGERDRLEQHAADCASKAAVIGLTRVLSLEWAPFGVTVNAVSPTVVEAPLGNRRGRASGASVRSGTSWSPLARPEEVVALIACVASDAAAMITGSNLLIHGGFTSA